MIFWGIFPNIPNLKFKIKKFENLRNSPPQAIFLTISPSKYLENVVFLFRKHGFLMNCCFNFRPKSASGRVWVYILFGIFQKNIIQNRKSINTPPLVPGSPRTRGGINSRGVLIQGIRLMARNGTVFASLVRLRSNADE